MRTHTPVLFGLGLFVLASVASKSSAQSLFELRPVVDSLQSGVVRMPLEHGKQSYLVAGNVLLKLVDVDSARVRSTTSSGGKPSYELVIHFKNSLSDSMYQLTSSMLHQRVAVLIDGKLLAAPMIMNRFRFTVVIAPVPNLAEGQELALKLNEAVRKPK